MALKSTTTILKNLRSVMKDVTYVTEPLQAYIIPTSDAHQSEYIDKSDARREFISGFTGSAGTVVVTETEALLWTDGRYYLQAEQELDSNWKLMKEGLPSTPKITEYLSNNLPPNSFVGVDGTLYSYREYDPLAKELKLHGHSFNSVQTNLVDLIWTDRPPRTSNIAFPLSECYTGQKSSLKLERIEKEMKEKNAQFLVVTALDEIAWLLNLRGSDIIYNPVFVSYVIILNSQIHLFINSKKITPEVTQHFNDENIDVIIHHYDQFFDYLKTIVQDLNVKNRGWVSPTSSYNVVNSVPENHRILQVTPILVMKAIKNDVEVEGMKSAHIRDGAALACYFSWLQKQVENGVQITETAAAEKLLTFRQKQIDFVSASFATISAFGPHGSIIHFSPSEKDNLIITNRSLYLCDSGAQYKDGTTDLTRTMHFGEPTQYQIDCFTRVFKGQQFLLSSIFPNKILGNTLDSYARRYLWEVGLDYGHGTSHGIGSFLNVHEGPMGITWRAMPDDPGLQENMFLSNEPGYYQENEWGIRIEDIIRIVKASTPHNHQDRGYLTFETVSMVPIQTKLLNTSLLTHAEITTLNKYHSQVLTVVGQLLDKQGETEAKEWLKNECKPIPLL